MFIKDRVASENSVPMTRGQQRTYGPPALSRRFGLAASLANAQSKPKMEPDRLLDNFGREAVPFVADFLHSLGY